MRAWLCGLDCSVSERRCFAALREGREKSEPRRHFRGIEGVGEQPPERHRFQCALGQGEITTQRRCQFVKEHKAVHRIRPRYGVGLDTRGLLVLAPLVLALVGRLAPAVLAVAGLMALALLALAGRLALALLALVALALLLVLLARCLEDQVAERLRK